MARRQLQALRKLDAIAAERFATELSAVEREHAAGASIEQRKATIETLLGTGQVDAAEAEIDQLSELGATKIAVDFLRQRVAVLRRGEQHRAEIVALEKAFDERLEQRDWAAARDIAHRLGDLGGSDTGPLYERLGRFEAEHRRRQSIEQGLATLEGFIARGRRAEAQLALQVLRGLDLDPRQLQLFQQRVNRL